MASCPKCENNTFKAELKTVDNLNASVVFIVCKSCDTIVGTIDTTMADRVRDIQTMIKKIN